MVTSSSNLRVDGARLWASIMEMAKIGALPGGGCGRLALTDDDKRARDLFASWCEQAGCTVTVDEMGNMFARRPGRNPDLPPVAAGSHLDTQPHGGKFDGIFGVLAALEAVRALNDAGVETESPIEVINWTNEEGSRFAPAMIASGVFAGLFDRDFAYRVESPEGETLGDELARIGYKGTEPCGEHPLGALFEAHIEQGPILEAAGVPIGIVSGAQGQRWYDVEVRGRDSHAGTTPMPARKDALVAAARMAARIEDIALGKTPDAVGTVGQFDVSPNSRNTIPGQVRFSVDIRHPDAGVLAEMDAAIRESFTAIAERGDVDVTVDQIWEKPPIEFDPRCVEAVREAAEELGYAHRDIVSGAGHDACQVCEVAPTGMIFVPCEDGISHNEIESATPEDLEMGCNVLLHAMLAVAGGMSESAFLGGALMRRPQVSRRSDAGRCSAFPARKRRRTRRKSLAMNWFVAGVIAMTSVVAASNFLVQNPDQRLADMGSVFVSGRLSRDRPHQSPGRTGSGAPGGLRRVRVRRGALVVHLDGADRARIRDRVPARPARRRVALQSLAPHRCTWWQTPLISSTVASVLDTAVFFSLAFAFDRDSRG